MKTNVGLAIAGASVDAWPMVKTVANPPCRPMPIFVRGVNLQIGEEAQFTTRPPFLPAYAT